MIFEGTHLKLPLRRPLAAALHSPGGAASGERPDRARVSGLVSLGFNPCPKGPKYRAARVSAVGIVIMVLVFIDIFYLAFYVNLWTVS